MIKFSKSDYEGIRAHAQQAYPGECCGALLGKMEKGERIVKQVMRCTNSHSVPATRYFIDPQDLIAAQKQARGAGLDVVGFYHSHPDQPARWSERDLAEAHWFACSYVITSVEAGLPSRTSSYVLCGVDEQDKRFEDENIEIN